MPRPPKVNHPIRELRAVLKMSQSAFGEAIGVAGRTIEALENGRFAVSRKIARRIYYVTGADTEELFKGASGKLLNPDGRKYRLSDYSKWSRRFSDPPDDVLDLLLSFVEPIMKTTLRHAMKEEKFGVAYCTFAEAVESAAEEIEHHLKKDSHSREALGPT